MSNPTLSDGSSTVTLLHTQEDVGTSKARVQPIPIPTFDSDETILIDFTNEEKPQLNGKANGIYLANSSVTRADGSSYSSDPVTALAQWVQDVMAFINGSQGEGYTLSSTERNRDINVAVKNFSWRRTKGNQYEVNWDMQLVRGDVTMTDGTISPNSVNIGSSWTLAGNDLHSVRDYTEIKKQGLQSSPIPLGSPSENIVFQKEGTKREIIITGRVDATQSTRNSFDSSIRNLIGDNTTSTYSSAFPGHDLEVMVKSFDPTREAGLTRIGDYSLKLIEGTEP